MESIQYDSERGDVVVVARAGVQSVRVRAHVVHALGASLPGAGARSIPVLSSRVRVPD